MNLVGMLSCIRSKGCEKFVGCNGGESLQIDGYSWIKGREGQQYWNQKLAATEKLPIFDDRDNEELEHDVHSFVDKTIHLTSAALRRGVEMSVL